MPTHHEVDLLQCLASALPFGLCIVNADGRVAVWNPAAERITGHLAHSMVGRGFVPDLLVRGAEACTPGSPGAGNESGFFRHVEGHRVPVRVRHLSLKDEDGTVIATAELFQDESAGNESLYWVNAAGVPLDPELGIPSQYASEEQLRVYLAREAGGLAVYLLSIRGLEEYAKRYGSEMVHVTLRALAQTIARLLTAPHFFGCWSEHRFLVLVPECQEAKFQGTLRRLQEIGNSCAVLWWGDTVVPSVEVASTMAAGGECGEAVVARLEAERYEGEARGDETRCS